MIFRKVWDREIYQGLVTLHLVQEFIFTQRPLSNKDLQIYFDNYTDISWYYQKDFILFY